MEGLMFRDPETGKWSAINVDTTEGAFRNGVDGFTFAPDGSVWIAADTEQPTIYHFNKSLKGREAWQVFDQRDGLPFITDTYDYSDLHDAIAVTADNVVWLETLEYVARCVFETP
jgi:hypothetical protein